MKYRIQCHRSSNSVFGAESRELKEGYPESRTYEREDRAEVERRIVELTDQMRSPNVWYTLKEVGDA